VDPAASFRVVERACAELVDGYDPARRSAIPEDNAERAAKLVEDGLAAIGERCGERGRRPESLIAIRAVEPAVDRAFDGPVPRNPARCEVEAGWTEGAREPLKRLRYENVRLLFGV
jgi:hypothetical protein